MSHSVDDRIVEMRFDNQHFERNVKTTMSTLDKLKESLSLKGSARAAQSEFDSYKAGLFSLKDSINKMWSSIEYDVANRMKRLLNDFTIAPIKSGFSEYETQMNAIQTILANTSSKGTTLEQVNSALDELNTYADKTIYNFTEMTRNIGTFTAAGIDLNTSVSAIQGIANLAAVSGSTSQQASTAMYQLSQALASGTVKLMDWNSVVNAGMGGEVFQNALKRTAKVMGTNVDAIIDKAGSFRESLKDGWITADVMTETLQQFTMAAEEGTEQWEAYKKSLKEKGYTEDQAVEILKMANSATDAATKVKTFTQLMDTLKESAQSGWTQTWELLVGDFEGAKNLFGTVYETLSEVINEGAEARNSLLKGALSSNWDKLTEYVTSAGISLDVFQDKIKETAKENGIAIDDIIKEHGSLANAFKKGALDGSLIVQTLKKFTGSLTATSTAAEVTTDKIEEFRSQVLRTIRGDFGNGAERVKAFADAGMDYATVQGIVNEVFADGVVNYEKLDECLANLSVSQLESMGYTEEQAEALKELARQAEETGTPLNDLINNLTKPGGKDLIIDTIKNALNGFVGVIRIVRDSWNKFLGMDSGGLYNIIEAINKFSKILVLTTKVIGENGEEMTVLTETGDKLRRIFEGLFAVIDVITTITSGAFKFAIELVCELFGMANVDVLELVAKFGDLLVNFRKFVFENNLVAKGIQALASGIIFVIDKIEKFIEAIMSIPGVSNAIEKFKMALVGTYQSGKDFVLGFINGIKDGSLSIVDLITGLGKKIIEKFRLSLGEHSPSKDAFQAAIDLILGFINGIKQFAKKAFAVIGDFGKKIVEKIQNIDWGTVAAVGIAVGLLVLFGLIAKAVHAIVKPFGLLEDVLSKVSGMFNAVSKTLKAASIIFVAGAISLLVAAIVSLSKVNPGLVWSSVAAIAVLGATLTGLVIAMEKLTTATDVDGNKINLSLAQISLAIMGVAASMLIAAAAIKILSSINWQGALVALGMFVALVVGISFAAKSISKLPKSADADILKFSVLLLSMSAMLITFASVAKQMSGLSVGELIKGLGALTVMVAELIIFSKLVSKDMPKVGSTFLALGAALGLMVIVVKMAAKLKASTLIRGMLVLVPLEAMMVGLIAMTQLFGKNAAKTGGTLLAMAASMLLLLQVVKTASKLELFDLAKGVVVVGALSVIMGLLVAITNLTGGNLKGLATTLLAMSASLAVIGAVSVLLGLVKTENLIKGVTAMGVLVGMMALLVLASKNAANCKGNLIILTVALGLMVGAVAALSFIDPVKILAASASISLMMGMFALLIKMSSTAVTSLITVGVMTLVIGALAAMLWGLSQLEVSSVLGVAASLSVLILSLSGACALLTIAGAAAGPALLGIGVLAALIVAVGALIVGIGALATYWTDMQTFLNVGIPILEQIGYGLGSFFGHIVGGFIGGASSALPALGENLSKFMTNMQDFIRIADSISLGTVAGVAALAGMILVLTAANVISGLTSWLTGGSSITSFANDISLIGPAISKFAKDTSGIDAASVESCANAALALAKMASAIPNTGGKLADWIGDNTLSAFGKELAAFGPHIKQYASDVAGIDAEAIEASAAAGTMLADMAGKLPNSGGILADWVGDNTLSAFGKELTKFGPYIKQYGDDVAGLNVDAVKKSASAAECLSAMAKNLPNAGGELAYWVGDNTLSSFGKELSKFGPYIKQYGDDVSKLNTKAVEKSADAAESLSELANGLPKRDGILQDWFGGKTDLAEFGEQLNKLGESLVSYSDYVETIDNKKIKDSAKAVETLSDIAVEISGISNGWFSSDLTFDDFGKMIKKFGEKLYDYYEKVKNIDVGTLSDITKCVSGLIKAIRTKTNYDKWVDVGKYFVEGLAEGIGKYTYKATEKARALVRAAIDAAEDEGGIASPSKITFKDGQWFALGLANGILDKVTIVKSSAEALMGSALDALKGPVLQEEAKEAGEETGDNYVLGMLGNIKTGVRNAADRVSASLDTTGKIKEESEEAGEETGKSFLGGIKDTVTNLSSGITDAVADTTGDSAAEGAKTAVDKFQEALDKIDAKDKKIELEFSIHGGDEAALYAQQYAIQLERLNTANEKYESVKKQHGEDSLETQKAYNELLQEHLNIKNMETAEVERLKQLERDRLDIAKETADLKFELWGGDEAALYAEQHAIQLERINIAQKEYDSLVGKLGVDALETKKAFNELMQAYVDLNTLVQTEEDRQYQHSMDWIESKKEANELSLFEELAAYKRVQSRYAEGSEKRIKADKEVARVQKEIADASESYYKDVEDIHKEYTDKKKELDKEYYDTVTAYNDKLEADIKDVWAAYDDAVKSRSDSIYGAFGLFDKVDASEAVDGSVLMENLQGQVDAIEDWKKDIQSLSKKGLNKELMSELYDMGPSAAANIKALNSLSRKELNKYEKLWKEKQSSAREQAKFELTGLRMDSLAQVRKLELDTDHALNQYRANWGTQMEQLKTDTDKQLDDAKKTWLETLKVSDPEKAEIKSEFTELVVEITNEVGNNMGWSLAGENAVAGIIQGINLNSHNLSSAVSSMMTGVLNSAYAVWGIHSPSKEFAKIGKFGILGLVQGIINNARSVMDAIKEVGGEAINGMSDSIAKIVDIINGDIDTQPTIRPVLDLSDVESKAGRLNAMFSREQAMTISSNRSNAKRGEIQNGSESSPNNATYNFTQNNYSPKALSKTDIYRQTKNQFSAMKRMVKA